MEQLFQLTIQTPTKAISMQTTNPDDVINMMKLSGQPVVSHEVVAISAPSEIETGRECETCGMETCECDQTMEEEYENTPDATRERGPRSHGEITDFGAPGQGHSKHGYRGTAASGDNPLTVENIITDYSNFKKKISLIEGLDPEQRSRLDSLLSDYREATDPSDYNSYYDPEEIIDTIRQEFGDKIASQVEAGSRKMHFPRQGHSTGYDKMDWRKPVDRVTKAGKMYKQDSDFRKNTIKSRYNLSGKSVTEGVAEGADPTTDSARDSRGDHRGEVKKNKDGSYVATNQSGSRKIFKSEKAAKAHANSGEQGVTEASNADELARLENDVRTLLANGDDYTAKKVAAGADTAADRNYLRKIIRQAMYGTGPEQGGVAEGSSDEQVVFSGTGANGGKYKIIQTSPTDFMIHANGKHIDTYSSLQRAMSVLKNEVPGLTKGVTEGAPELLKKEMPLHRHAEKLLAQNGVSKDDPDYHYHLNNTITYLRQFGNIDLINKSDEQGVAEGSIKDAESALARHGQRKVDHEQKYGPMNGADLHQHEVMRKQLLDKKRRAQNSYAKKQGVAEGSKQTKYAIKHKETGKVLSTHDDEQTARDEHRGLGSDKAKYKLVKTTKAPKEIGRAHV